MSPSQLESSKSLCAAFADPSVDPEYLLSHFSSDATAHEHGPQTDTMPFLGRTIPVKIYMPLLQKYVKFSDMSFFDYTSDPGTSRLSVKGKATFTWTATHKSWDEVFTYVLGFDQDSKVKTYEVWADPLSLYAAAKGMKLE
ncbi:hypothetical protein G7K_6378-t1 [Saitoella complicata NRRL Y-17804]|uniref:SnoaL-like domain-containing protein n=1 Tax=Saitoella complicata (strain BCRC 22490 / CBS 7301 / JCM 7358 / NBRC 10748 / NRRL Y-17804) TaxID=698492 RepID=A0A0E9NR61_SAICN|nr:hypothetical protein G7K_6378-t1 [Saitoella complicata NRRL Y-17804]